MSLRPCLEVVRCPLAFIWLSIPESFLENSNVMMCKSMKVAVILSQYLPQLRKTFLP